MRKGKKHMKKLEALRGLSGLMILFAFVLLFSGFSDLSGKMKKPVDINTVTADQLKEGLVVEGDLQYNMGQFAETYTTYNFIRVGSKKANYIIPLTDGTFIGLENYFKKQNALFDAQADETYNYLAEESKQAPRTIHIRGKVKRMNYETIKIFKQAFSKMGFSDEDITQSVTEFYVEYKNYDKWILEMIGGVVLVVLTILARVSSGHIKADAVTAASSGTIVNDDWNEFYSNYETGAPMDTNTSSQPEPIIGAADQPTVLEPVVEENKESSGLSLKL